ncbi:MAG: hypothetical protein LBJ69_02870 [Holosporales bacterium]|nr:hypothetical protein [Holosporales bacterium]
MIITTVSPCVAVVPLDLQDLVFFVEACDYGFDDTCRKFGFGREDGLLILTRLSNSFNFKIFKSKKGMMRAELAHGGELFLETARKMSVDLLRCTLLADDSSYDDYVVIRTDALDGKHFILPCLSRLKAGKAATEARMELLTYEDNSKDVMLNSHILFRGMNRFDQIFFEKLWTVRMSQGLYASEEYLNDVGQVPENPEQLSRHSILGYGDSFDVEYYKSLNWHLSGSSVLGSLKPSIMISSQAVLTNAVEFNLGIGPVRNYYNRISDKKLTRILPDVEGPTISIDFAVRKFLPARFKSLVDDIESTILGIVHDIGLEVIRA